MSHESQEETDQITRDATAKDEKWKCTIVKQMLTGSSRIVANQSTLFLPCADSTPANDEVANELQTSSVVESETLDR